MEADDREARGRRGLLWFRLTFYPLALGLGVFLLLHGRASGDDEGVVLVGRTGQGERMTLTVFDSRPVALRTVVGISCPHWRRRFTWAPSHNGPVPFRFDGSHLRVDETYHEAWADGSRDRLVVSLDGTVEDGHARGTLTSTEAMRLPNGRHMVCGSGAVRFSVEEPPHG